MDIKILEKKRQKGERHPLLYFKLGRHYFQQGLLDEALEVISEGIIFFPENSYLYLLKGKILREKGELTKAIEMLREAIRFDPLNFVTSLLLAETFEEKGDKREALVYYRRAFALYPWKEEIEEKIKKLEKEERHPIHLPGATDELKELFEAIEAMGKKSLWAWTRFLKERKHGEEDKKSSDEN